MSETEKLCKHNMPIEFGCYKCYWEKNSGLKELGDEIEKALLKEFEKD